RGKAAPSGVRRSDGGAVARCEKDGQAIRYLHDADPTGSTADDGVRRHLGCAPLRPPLELGHVGAVNLLDPGRLRGQLELCTQAPAILNDCGRRITHMRTHVE
ncbi:MAG TPA: hypothetical protein VEC10_13520, partial [Steroidobacteraceae bacterium]|nr:hypothetical protein [Steroidobacteraceae bacterium]